MKTDWKVEMVSLVVGGLQVYVTRVTHGWNWSVFDVKTNEELRYGFRRTHTAAQRIGLTTANRLLKEAK